MHHRYFYATVDIGRWSIHNANLMHDLMFVYAFKLDKSQLLKLCKLTCNDTAQQNEHYNCRNDLHSEICRHVFGKSQIRGKDVE